MLAVRMTKSMEDNALRDLTRQYVNNLPNNLYEDVSKIIIHR